ncbi:hypothetical protein K9M78_00820 [Candidatus Bipolaricaulota bacterium]|nr:hypothetical protein [Candidatus Bipolaricaulota bacterium]
MSPPKVVDFLKEFPLYRKVEISPDAIEWLAELTSTSLKLDSYCPQCTKVSTFESVGKSACTTTYRPKYAPDPLPDDREKAYNDLLRFNKEFKIVLKCPRDHIMGYYFALQRKEEQDFIMKIGQYPSEKDQKRDEFKRNRKIVEDILSSEKADEYMNAIILYDHNYGIGAFIYLRRIFESMINNTYQNHKNEVSFEEGSFKEAKAKDKINALRDYLPDFMVNNKHIYDILSKGVHELDQFTCQDLFDTVRTAVEIILEQEFERKKREEKIEKAEKELNNWESEL